MKPTKKQEKEKKKGPIGKALCWLCRRHCQPAAGYLVITMQPFPKNERKDVITMDLKNTQGIDLTITPTKPDGQPGQVDGVPVWSSSDESIVTVTPTADGLGCRVLTVDNAVGTATVKVSADADIGAGVQEITAALDFNVSDPNVSNLNLTAGAVFEK